MYSMVSIFSPGSMIPSWMSMGKVTPLGEIILKGDNLDNDVMEGVRVMDEMLLFSSSDPSATSSSSVRPSFMFVTTAVSLALAAATSKIEMIFFFY